MSFLNLQWNGDYQITPKASPLLILDLLVSESDQEHPLLQEDIIVLLNRRYGLEMQRKAIGANIKLLEDLGFEIKHTRKGIYIVDSYFQESEVRYLIDAVFLSRNIPSGQVKNIAERLTGFLSRHKKKNFSYITASPSISKRKTGVDFFLNVDYLVEAIEKERKISFKYRCYDYDGNPKLRGMYGPQTFVVSPYYLVANNGRYYLLAYYKHGHITAYRVDHMVDIKVLEDGRADISSVLPGFSLAKYLNDRVYLFGGDSVDATLLIKKVQGVDALNDWFGDRVKYYSEDGKHYASVKADVLSLSYWCCQYGEDVTAVGPRELVDKVKELLIEMANDYGILPPETTNA